MLNKSAYQANYSAMTGVSSLTLSTKLTWMDDFISRTTSENRPVFSCRISILEESKERKDEFFPETSKSECLHMENDLRIILKEKMKAEHRKAVEMSFERKDFPSQCFDKQEVLCLTIRSVSVGRLSCLELLGNQVRNRGKDSSKVCFSCQHLNALFENIFFAAFILYFTNGWILETLVANNPLFVSIFIF